MDGEQWSIGLEQLGKPGLFFLVESFVVFQEQEPGALENFLAFLVQLGLLPS
jgi:hypothetical protein